MNTSIGSRFFLAIALASYFYSPSLLAMNEQVDSLQCSICFGDFSLDAPINDVLRFECSHVNVYHEKCIKEWIYASEYNTCPICRAKKRFDFAALELAGTRGQQEALALLCSSMSKGKIGASCFAQIESIIDMVKTNSDSDVQRGVLELITKLVESTGFDKELVFAIATDFIEKFKPNNEDMQVALDTLIANIPQEARRRSLRKIASFVAAVGIGFAGCISQRLSAQAKTDRSSRIIFVSTLLGYMAGKAISKQSEDSLGLALTAELGCIIGALTIFLVSSLLSWQ